MSFQLKTQFKFSVIDHSGNYVTTDTVFNLIRTTLNGMDFKFVSHGLWSEKQNILFRQMYIKEFWILTNKCGNNLKHQNEAKWPCGQNPKFFLMHALTTDVLLLLP